MLYIAPPHSTKRRVHPILQRLGARFQLALRGVCRRWSDLLEARPRHQEWLRTGSCAAHHRLTQREQGSFDR
ncbi:hypothetical protein HUO07_06180 [Halomonas sp. QX-1]|uniref:Uncharacterized protein n=1 Tax=Vreelandella maris TaxID=2729617 RepID=A0A7Y6RBA6_9GAMM|nr:hypothetical protein [Halomonas maris]